MRKTVQPKIEFKYSTSDESAGRLDRAYARIFTIARENLKKKSLKRKEVNIVHGRTVAEEASGSYM